MQYNLKLQWLQWHWKFGRPYEQEATSADVNLSLLKWEKKFTVVECNINKIGGFESGLTLWNFLVPTSIPKQTMHINKQCIMIVRQPDQLWSQIRAWFCFYSPKMLVRSDNRLMRAPILSTRTLDPFSHANFSCRSSISFKSMPPRLSLETQPFPQYLPKFHC
jgi:hypothetical protein